MVENTGSSEGVERLDPDLEPEVSAAEEVERRELFDSLLVRVPGGRRGGRSDWAVLKEADRLGGM